MKTKFPHALALQAAREIGRLLWAHCERITVAGSIRRMKSEVGDIELLYIPRISMRPDPGDLFGKTHIHNHVDEALTNLINNRVLVKRLNKDGHETWGEANKYAVHVSSGIPVDLFATTTTAWYNYLVCRTGGLENNKLIATEALRQGWKWHPTSYGFEPVNPDGTRDNQRKPFRVTSEHDVYHHLGLTYIEPQNRQ